MCLFLRPVTLFAKVFELKISLRTGLRLGNCNKISHEMVVRRRTTHLSRWSPADVVASSTLDG